MSAKHTPGPWTASQLYDGCVTVACGPPADYKAICEVGWKYGTTTDVEKIANAVLIAAAPELLQAAYNTVNHYAAVQPGATCLVDELNVCGGLKHWSGSDACPLCSARAVIAKAEGH